MLDLIKRKKEYLVVAGLSLFLSLIMFKDVILNNNSILWFYGDSVEQQYEFLLGYWQMFRDGSFKLWQWSLGYGANQLSYVFYNLFSPFNLLILIFPKECIRYAFLYLTIIKFCVFSICSYLWISKISNDKKTAIVLSLLLTFCGWNLFYLQYNFLDPLVFYPIILYFIEIYLDSNKKIGLIISTALLTFVNYYFMYMFAPFACLYALFRYLYKHQGVNVTKVIIDGIKFFVIFVLSMMISAFVLFPCIKMIMGTSRLSDGSTIGLFVTSKDLYKFVCSFFSPTLNYIDPCYFVKPSTLTYAGWGGGAPLFVGIVTPLLLIYFVLSNKSYKKTVYMVFGAVLFLFMLSPYFYKLFQGTIDTRWFYMYSFYFVLILVQVIDEHISLGLDKKKIIISFLTVILVIAGLIGIAYFKRTNEISKLNKQLFYEIILISICLVYLILALFKNKKVLFLVMIIFEIVVNNHIYMSVNIPILHGDFNYQDSVNEKIEWIKQNNQDNFYRVLYDNFGVLLANQPYADQIPGNSFYLSIYAYSQDDFMNTIKSRWSMPQSQGFYSLRNILSNKYWITDDVNLSLVPPGYSYTGVNGIYINDNYVELGYLSNKTLNSSILNEVDEYKRDYLLSKYIITDDSNNYNYEDNDIETLIDYCLPDYCEVVLSEELRDDTLIIFNGGVPELNVRLYYCGNEVLNKSFWQYHYTEIYIPEDFPVDMVVIESKDVDNTGLVPSLYVERETEKKLQDLYLEKTKLDDVHVSGNTITANVSINDEMTLFTSIPCEDGWIVYVNGIKTDYKTVNLGFIGIELPKGNHELVFKYETPLMKEGIVVSLISVVVLIYLSKKEIV